MGKKHVVTKCDTDISLPSGHCLRKAKFFRKTGRKTVIATRIKKKRQRKCCFLARQEGRFLKSCMPEGS